MGFIPSVLVDVRWRRRAVGVSIRRPRICVRASASSGEGNSKADQPDSSVEPGSVGDDSYWADLANDIYGDAPAVEEMTEGPKFMYPDGVDPKSFFEVSEEDASAWGSWNTALERDAKVNMEDVPARDPRKETDFWRSAAKEFTGQVVPDAAGGQNKTEKGELSVAEMATADISTESVPAQREERDNNLPGGKEEDLTKEALEAMKAEMSPELQPYVDLLSQKDGTSLSDSSYWSDLAKDIGAPAGEKNETTGPKFVYPEGVNPEDFFTQNNDDKDAWSTWNSAIEKEASVDPNEIEYRDPQKEKDFWRGTAQELIDSSTNETNDGSSGTESAPPAEPLPSNPKDIWSAARNVAAETQAIQDQLREEMETYDVNSEKNPYRSVAKDLLADFQRRKDLNEQLKVEYTAEVVDERATSASEWDPDRDWRRFDDVDAELERQRLALESSSRWKEEMADIENEAVAINPETYSSGGAAPTSPIRFTDENGQLLSREEVDRLASEGAVFIDEKGEKVDMSGAILDSPSTSAQDYIAPPENTNPGQERTLPRKRFSSSTYGGDRGGIERDLELLAEEGVNLRDPKAETDFWRSAAKELSTDGSGSNIGASEGNDKIDIGSDESGEDKSAWDSWTNARKDWETQLENAQERDPKKEVDMWRGAAQELTGTSSSTEKADWGSGFQKASTGSAWASWESSNPMSTVDKEKWWGVRQDNVTGRKEPTTASESSDPGFWTGIAKDVTKKAQSPSEETDSEGKRNLGESVNMWLDFARTVNAVDNDETNPTIEQ